MCKKLCKLLYFCAIKLMDRIMGPEVLEESRRALDMLSNGDVTEALRVSGEALARADSIWRNAFNATETDTKIELDTLLQAGYSHVEALIAAEEWIEAFSLSLILLYCPAIDGCRMMSIDRGCMVLWVRSLEILQLLLNEFPQEDDAVREHVTKIVTYEVSMLYFVYNRLMEQAENGEIMTDAYELLRQYSFAVNTPEINVNGVMVKPDEDYRPVMADLMGRSRALGIFKVDAGG